MNRKLMITAMLFSALVWNLAPSAQAAKNSATQDATPTAVKTDMKTDAKPTPPSTETPAMQDAMNAYSAGHYMEAFVITEPMAKMNHADAQYLLGLMYEFGHGVKKDASKALELFTNSASQGYAAAQAKLGQIHLADSSHRDYGKAKDWFEKAANQGYALAYSALGDIYSNGYGVAKNKDTALDYYKKAAAAGDAEACLHLGKTYESGSTAADRTQALFWYKKGAELGNKLCAQKVQQLQ